MILIDFNGIAISNIVTQKLAVEENLIRHMILNSIRMYRSKFHEQYGEVVICCDAGNNWRRDVYPQYKYKRKVSREASADYWNEIFTILNKIRSEIEENFPYKFMMVDKCEADDIIAQLAFNTQEFGNYEDVLIVSADKDFAQLQVMSNVKQYSPMKKKFIVEDNPRLMLLQHVLKGDSSDGVPNVLSDDDCFVEGRRQSPVTKKFIESVVAADCPEECTFFTEDISRNYQRNKKMIDLSELPEMLKTEIINKYESQDPWSNRGKVLGYLIANNCKRLIEDIKDFL